MGGCIPEVMVGGHDHAGLPAGRDHRLGVGQAGRERLLAEYMDAGFGRRDRLGAMALVGGRDIDGVDAGGEEVAEIGHRERNAELLGIGLPALRSVLITATMSPPASRIAPIIHSRPMTVAPIRPHRIAGIISLRSGDCCAHRKSPPTSAGYLS